jgi:light-regulated signal transduction histidine kinase (bacteriophytochrome)
MPTHDRSLASRVRAVLPRGDSLGFVMAAGVAALAAWRLNGDVREQRRRALDRAVAAERGLALSTAELERSNRELEEFAYVASHDLSEPLRTVAGFMRLLEQRYDAQLDERGREFIAYALDGSERMQRLIDGLLHYSRVGRRAPALEPVELGAVVTAACDALRARIDDSGATVTVHDPLPAVLGDADQLTQAVQNLLSNALKFTLPGDPPRVDVACERDGDEWCVRIADHGIGVPPEDREQVFAMFHRLHGPDRYEGSGLGLAIAERIVSRHGGRIGLEETPGGGATVAFTLRAALEAAPGVRSAAADLAPAGG